MLQDKKPHVGSNILNPLYTRCETSQAAIIGMNPVMSFVHYLSFWTKVLQPKKRFPLSIINVTPQVVQWIQCCLEDHILHLEKDGFLFRIIQYWTEPDINMTIWKSHLLKMALVPETVFLWLTHTVIGCYKLLSGPFSPTLLCKFYWNFSLKCFGNIRGKGTRKARHGSIA